MSIVVCPSCQARYTLPKGAPRPPRLKCPKCQGQIPVPAEGAAPAGQPGPSKSLSPHSRSASSPGDGTIVSGSVPWQELDLPPGHRISLSVLDGPDKGKQFTLTKAWTTLGRREGDILLQDPEVSGSHAVLKVAGGECWVKDLNSTNGTYVNGRRVDEAPVANLDELRVGRTRLGIYIVQETADSAESDLTPAPEPSPPPKRRLLIVTPHRTLRDQLLSGLRSSEWHIQVAASGLEVRDAVEPEGRGPLALLLDLELPANERLAMASSLRGLPSAPPLLGVAGPWSMRELLAKLEGLEVIGLVDQSWPPQRITTVVDRFLAPRRPGGIARMPVKGTVTYARSGVEAQGTIAGIASWGMLIQTKDPLLPDTEVSLLFILPEIPRVFRTKGRVVARDWKEGRATKGQMEVWFMNLDPQGRSQIAAFLLVAERYGSLRDVKGN